VDPIEEAITKFPWIFSLPYQHFLNFPLTNFLLWLGHTANFNPNTLIINCFDKEALDINKAFSDQAVSILSCYWHLWQAWEKNITTKVSCPIFLILLPNLLDYRFLSNVCAAKRRKWSFPRILLKTFRPVTLTRNPGVFFLE